MKKWCECKIIIHRKHVQLLESFFGNYSFAAYSLFQKPRASKSEIRVYLPIGKKDFLAKIHSALGLLTRLVSSPNDPEIYINVRSDSDYKDEWKKFFRPVKIGRFVIVPSWEKRKGKNNIELDPGMAFGTGHHFTTSYCVKMIQKYGRSGMDFLDVGSGSGILCIAAAKCRVKKIVGIDLSLDAISIAAKNFKKNCPGKTATFKKASLEKYSPLTKFDCVAANLYDLVLVKNAKSIIRLMKKKSVLILSGIRFSKTNDVEKAYKKLHLLDKTHDQKEEWSGLVFRK